MIPVSQKLSKCKERDFKIITQNEWDYWMLNAGLNPSLIFEGIS